MKLRKQVLFCAAVFLFTGSVPAQTPNLGNDAQAPIELGKGVVIEAVKNNLEANKAGLQGGDIVLNWSRADARGDITSPFDLVEVEVEQGPRGEVTLEGWRGAEKRGWALRPGPWAVRARPNLPDGLLANYQEGEKLAKAGKLQEAVAHWRLATGAAQYTQFPWLSYWFAFHAGEMQDDVEQWKEAGTA